MGLAQHAAKQPPKMALPAPSRRNVGVHGVAHQKDSATLSSKVSSPNRHTD
jgi:hypothetical protein